MDVKFKNEEVSMLMKAHIGKMSEEFPLRFGDSDKEVHPADQRGRARDVGQAFVEDFGQGKGRALEDDR